MKVVGWSYGRGCTLVHAIYVITIKHTVIGVISGCEGVRVNT